MTPEKQRIAIAAVCISKAWLCSCGLHWLQIDGKSCGDQVPDYLNDLNAMHEAEAILRDEQVNIFQAHLNAIIARGCRVCDFRLHPSDKLWHATAAQRAEAFLRTVGKWEDSQ